MKIRKNVKLAPYTTFKIGGAAKYFVEAKSEEEIIEALKFAQEKKLAIFVLGGGSNVLVRDKGFDGVVIRLCNSQLVISNLDIICDGGCLLNKVVSESIKAGLTGLEWAIGVPGTVAGAVRGNAGCFGGEISESVKNIDALDMRDFSKKKFHKKDCKFSYRNSIFKRNPDLLIIRVGLNLSKGSTEKSRKKIAEISKIRKKTQPIELMCPGSFFKNPVVKNKNLIKQYELDTGKKVLGQKIPAAYLIEEAGLKGKKIGGAQVGKKHANFIVNTGKSTAEDVMMLVAIIKTKVRNKFGVQLQEEVQTVGF